MEVKETWRLTNTDNGKETTYDKFAKFEKECKKLLNLNQDDKYSVAYLWDEEVRETAKMSDYFTIDKLPLIKILVNKLMLIIKSTVYNNGKQSIKL